MKKANDMEDELATAQVLEDFASCAEELGCRMNSWCVRTDAHTVEFCRRETRGVDRATLRCESTIDNYETHCALLHGHLHSHRAFCRAGCDVLWTDDEEDGAPEA